MQKKCLLHNRFTIGPFKMCGMWFFTSCIPDRIQDAELLAHVIRTANCAFAKRMHRKRVGKEKIKLDWKSSLYFCHFGIKTKVRSKKIHGARAEILHLRLD